MCCSKIVLAIFNILLFQAVLPLSAKLGLGADLSVQPGIKRPFITAWAAVLHCDCHANPQTHICLLEDATLLICQDARNVALILDIFQSYNVSNVSTRVQEPRAFHSASHSPTALSAQGAGRWAPALVRAQRGNQKQTLRS